MKILLFLSLIYYTVSDLLDKYTITKEKLDELKRIAPYEVYDYDEHPFKDLTPYEIMGKLCDIPLNTTEPNEEEMKLDENLPEEYNANDHIKECLRPIRDQQQCGSCWAFANLGVLSDRFCIKSNKTINVTLSVQNLVSCDSTNMGCNGGLLTNSFRWLIRNGVVEESCYPYTSGISKQAGICLMTGTTCVDRRTPAKKYYASTFRTLNNTAAIQKDIIENGPVATGFQVYQDFLSYKGGIYRRRSNQGLGGHAVVIVGWGRDARTRTSFWIAANSWGTRWGEQGYFRFAIGNCCGFEQNAASALPKIDAIEASE